MVTQDAYNPPLEATIFDTEEAAPKVHVSPRTLRRIAGRGEISHYRVGRRLLFSDQDIAEFMNKAKVSAHK
jgi:excisionase family DNA binding protein